MLITFNIEKCIVGRYCRQSSFVQSPNCLEDDLSYFVVRYLLLTYFGLMTAFIIFYSDIEFICKEVDMVCIRC